ncbi:hypothetical protein ABW20_dc0103637 [Dactylellina cionopaga]|nr:hypothetical protein ABW20_dc0103637 [Dactylellina cionopaga]
MKFLIAAAQIGLLNYAPALLLTDVDILNCYNFAIWGPAASLQTPSVPQNPVSPSQRFDTTSSSTAARRPRNNGVSEKNEGTLIVENERDRIPWAPWTHMINPETGNTTSGPHSLNLLSGQGERMTRSEIPEMPGVDQMVGPHLGWPLQPDMMAQLSQVSPIPEDQSGAPPDTSLYMSYPIMMPPSHQLGDSGGLAEGPAPNYQDSNYLENHPNIHSTVVAQPLNSSPFHNNGPLAAMSSYTSNYKSSTSASSSRQSGVSEPSHTSIECSIQPYLVYVSFKGQGCNKYPFPNPDVFTTGFQPWLKGIFKDPPFNWDSMEFHHDSRDRDEILTSLEEVADELDMWFVRTGLKRMYYSSD